MKLDPRIENESLIYTPFSTAKTTLWRKGYFTSNIYLFENLADCIYGELVCHDSKLDNPYCCRPDDASPSKFYAFYIPESSLKSEENKSDKPCGVSQNKDSETVLVPFWAIYLLKYIQQKLAADKITVLQSTKEMIYLIDCICNSSSYKEEPEITKENLEQKDGIQR